MAKGPDAFRTISEAAEELNVPQHVLRFWETKFSFIRPMKRAGGRRFYRPQDIAVLAGVRTLLHDQGYTIKAVQKLHREEGVKRLLAALDPDAAPTILEAAAPESFETDMDAERRARLSATLAELQDIKARLDALLSG